MWLASLAILTAVAGWRLWVGGPRHALGCIVVLSLLVPKWVIQEIGGFPIDMRLAAAIVGLVAYCLHREGKILTPLVWLDLLALAFVAAHLMSDSMSDGFRWTIPLQAYGEWILPYWAGRLALQSLDDVRQLLPFATVVAVVLGGWAIFEALAGINVPELLYGTRPMEGAHWNLSRWDFKRAYGPTMNPIYFGALQLLLFPWAMYAASRASRYAGPLWWHVAPWISGLGIFATLSRAPQGALIVLLYVTALLLAGGRRRWALTAVAAAGLVVSATQYERVLDSLHLWGGDPQSTIVIDGEEVPYSSVLHRAHLFQVYGTAMRRAGPFGFGTEAVTGFPVNVPVGAHEIKTLDRLWSIDNAYILFVLRFGYFGVACFIFLGFATIATYVLMALSPSAQGSVFYASMAGAIIGSMLLLLTVWMPHDFGFWYTWSVGAAAGLTAHGSWRTSGRRRGRKNSHHRSETRL